MENNFWENLLYLNLSPNEEWNKKKNAVEIGKSLSCEGKEKSLEESVKWQLSQIWGIPNVELSSDLTSFSLTHTRTLSLSHSLTLSLSFSISSLFLTFSPSISMILSYIIIPTQTYFKLTFCQWLHFSFYLPSLSVSSTVTLILFIFFILTSHLLHFYNLLPILFLLQKLFLSHNLLIALSLS